MNKKILIVSIVVLVIVLAGGFFAFKYFYKAPAPVQNSGTQNLGQENTQTVTAPEIQVQAGGVEATGIGGLTICVDKCGDGVCQKTDPSCKDSMNCVCQETKADCPKDCK